MRLEIKKSDLFLLKFKTHVTTHSTKLVYLMSYTNAVKENKIVFNLKDVNKAPELVKGVPQSYMFYQQFDKRISLYMVENAYIVCDLNNFKYGVYPKPYPKRGII